MPSTSKRRRKFSVQNKIKNRNLSKSQKAQTSFFESNTQTLTPNNDSNCIINASSCKNINPVRNSGTLILAEVSTGKIDKEVSASSTVIKLDTLLNIHDSFVDQFREFEDTHNDIIETQDATQISRDRPFRRDKYPRQHRIKVRSPKRRLLILEQGKLTDFTNNCYNIRTIGTCAINWKEEIAFINGIDSIDDEERPSTHSLDDMCRICHGGESISLELGRLISACSCRGTVGRVHVKCLERWLTESGKSRCELCGTRYTTRRVHRYGVARALVMWILSQNAKQLMVDSLGIILMSPLAVLAAWLSGRTLAGLMTQETHVTPWPLASTFVLACMTLVCYYCWIVSAATRHALGWWIWYRSQYEVRLEIQES